MLATILLVEDEPLIALAEKAMLEAGQYRVELAANGQEAITFCEANPQSVDLILMDIDLGDHLNGVETARRILALGDYPIVFLSSRTEKELLEMTESVASYGHLPKQAGDQLLLTVVRSTLQLHAAHRQVKESERKNRAARDRLAMLFAMTEFIHDDEEKVFDMALDGIVKLTQSDIGYIYFFNEATRFFTLFKWSTKVMHQCTVVEPQTQYALEKTGIWGEVVRQRQAVLVNDFDAPNPHKKGYPAGHVALKRFLAIPIFEGEHIVATAGVGNKTEPYTQDDVEMLNAFMTSVWQVIQRIQTSREMKENTERFRALVEATSDASSSIYISPEGKLVREWARLDLLTEYGYSPEEIARFETWRNIVHPDDKGAFDQAIPRILSGQTVSEELRIVTKEGKTRWIRNTVVPQVNRLTGKVHRLLSSVKDITIRKEAEERLKKAADEKDLLMRELAHRVKNNMLMVSSLLGLQASRHNHASARCSLLEAEHRVKSLMHLYTRLYQDKQTGKLEIGPYLEDIARELFASCAHGKSGTITFIADPIALEIKRAVALGLILNEALTNSCKYAGGGAKELNSQVTLREEADRRARLTIKDNGPGFPLTDGQPQEGGFGFQLLALQAAELDATLSLRNEDGAVVDLVFSID